MMYRLAFLLLLFIASVPRSFAQQPNNLVITPLTGDFYVYTTFNQYEGNRIPAHGMYLITHSGAVLFDTPWDTTQFQPLLDSMMSRHRSRVTICIATHWHSDRTEGLEYYRRQGIKTYTTTLTDQLSAANGKKRAEFLMTGDTTFRVGQYAFDIYYPGEGHTADNIIAWFGRERILYGGCLIKGAEASDLGYLGDANTTAYARTLQNVKRRCPNPAHIIVSHHNWTNNQSLNHSIKLAKKLKKTPGA